MGYRPFDRDERFITCSIYKRLNEKYIGYSKLSEIIRYKTDLTGLTRYILAIQKSVK